MLDEARLRRVLEVGRAVVSELDLKTVLQRVLEVARELTGARYAAIGILDRERRELERFLTSGIDAATHRQIGALPRGRDVLSVPIRVLEANFGNLYLAEKQNAADFDADDEEAIVLLASWAGVAIANAHAYHDQADRRRGLEQAVDGLEAAMAIARAVGGETDLKRILELIVQRARALLGARGVLILLREQDELVVAAVAGQLDGELLEERIAVADWISDHVMRSQRPERLADIREQLHVAMERQISARSGLFVPLVFRGRALGVLNVFDRDDDSEFTAEDQRLLEGFAASAATAVATAQTVASESLHRTMEASERERQRWALELHDETLQELAGLKVLLASARRSSGRTCSTPRWSRSTPRSRACDG